MGPQSLFIDLQESKNSKLRIPARGGKKVVIEEGSNSEFFQLSRWDNVENGLIV